MKVIIYRSQPSWRTTKRDLEKLLLKADIYNREHDICALIFINNEKIIQLIEGEDEVVDALYERILKDKRHKNVETVIDKSIEERIIGVWGMSVYDLWDDDKGSELQNDLKLLDKLYKNADIELIEAFKEEIFSS